MSNVTAAEMQMLQDIRAKADDLARAIHEANTAGFTINFNINPTLSTCDRFNVFKMQPIDLRSAAN